MTTGSSGIAARTPFEGGIFISYRRSLAGGHAGHLYGKLRAEYGARRVFFDERAIPKGADFPAEINAALDRAHVILIVIANGWAENMAEREQREDVDWVLHEVERALQRRLDTPPAEVRVVLVGRATMPDQLPQSIAALQKVNANALDSEVWDERNSAFQELMADVQRAMPELMPTIDLDKLAGEVCRDVRQALEALSELPDFKGLLDLWATTELAHAPSCRPGQALVDLKAAIAKGRWEHRLSRDGFPDHRKVGDIQKVCLKIVAEWLRLGACQVAADPTVLGGSGRPAELESLATQLFALAARDGRQASLRIPLGVQRKPRQVPVARALDQGTVDSGILQDKSSSILDQLWLMDPDNKLDQRPYPENPTRSAQVRDLSYAIESMNDERGQSRVTIALTGADPKIAGAELLRVWLREMDLDVDVIVRTGTTQADHSRDEGRLIHRALECIAQIERIGCDSQ